MTIIDALSKASAAVGAVRKDQKNQQQKFNFRGIDQVVNSTHAAFREQGIIVIPSVESLTWDEITSASGKRQAWVKGVVSYTFHHGESSVVAKVAAEATDFADKATAKLMSVAYRTALLQVLHLPTDEPDADAEYVERGTVEAAKANHPAGKRKPVDDPLKFKRESVTKLLRERKVPVDAVKLFLAEWKIEGLSEAGDEALDSVRNWVEQAYAPNS